MIIWNPSVCDRRLFTAALRLPDLVLFCMRRNPLCLVSLVGMTSWDICKIYDRPLERSHSMLSGRHGPPEPVHTLPPHGSISRGGMNVSRGGWEEPGLLTDPWTSLFCLVLAALLLWHPWAIPYFDWIPLSFPLLDPSISIKTGTSKIAQEWLCRFQTAC